MKKLVFAVVVVASLYIGVSQTDALRELVTTPASQTRDARTAQTDELRATFTERKSGSQVTGEGTVTKLLADDNDGSRHQRFILTLPSGQTVLITHNIDIAPRIDSLRTGDVVAFNGVYEWNAKGGLVHWTHRDPSGRHQPGWLKHAGQIYQ